jgi:hypothetical protein
MTNPHLAVSILSDIFPSVRHALGDDRFNEMLKAFVADRTKAAMPADHFPAYLRDHATHLIYRNFLAQLATLELTLHNMHHDADEHGDQLRLLRFDYPVSDYLRAVEQMIETGEDEIIGAPVATQRCWVAVYRHGKQVGRMTIDPNQFNNVLDCLTQREPQTIAAVAAAN